MIAAVVVDDPRAAPLAFAACTPPYLTQSTGPLDHSSELPFHSKVLMQLGKLVFREDRFRIFREAFDLHHFERSCVGSSTTKAPMNSFGAIGLPPKRCALARLYRGSSSIRQ
jgi:hypothetical protein